MNVTMSDVKQCRIDEVPSGELFRTKDTDRNICMMINSHGELAGAGCVGKTQYPVVNIDSGMFSGMEMDKVVTRVEMVAVENGVLIVKEI